MVFASCSFFEDAQHELHVPRLDHSSLQLSRIAFNTTALRDNLANESGTKMRTDSSSNNNNLNLGAKEIREPSTVISPHGR
jgi:hypothetical protein